MKWKFTIHFPRFGTLDANTPLRVRVKLRVPENRQKVYFLLFIQRDSERLYVLIFASRSPVFGICSEIISAGERILVLTETGNILGYVSVKLNEIVYFTMNLLNYMYTIKLKI